MGKIKLSELPNKIATGAKRNSPIIFVTVGTIGMVSAGVMAVKATPRALELIEEEKERINRDLYEQAEESGERYEPIDKLHPKDVVRLTWKCYIPAAVTGVLSIACITGGSAMNLRRSASLATAYSLTENAFREYRNKVVETVGEKKDKVVREAIAKDHLEKNPVENKEVIITDRGDTLCYDVLSGRYFMSNMDQLNKAVNEINRRMINHNYISLNEFYYEIGLSNTTLGNVLGWHIDRGTIELEFSAQLADNGEPCLVVDYMDNMPIYDYDMWT